MTAELQNRTKTSSPVRRDHAGRDSMRRHLPGSGPAGEDLLVARRFSMRIQLRIIAGDTRVISGNEIPRFDKRRGRPETIGFAFAEVRTALAGIQERLITVWTRFAAFPENQLLNGQINCSESRIVVVAHVADVAQQSDPFAVRRDDHRFRMEISDLRDRIAEAVHRSGRVAFLPRLPVQAEVSLIARSIPHRSGSDVVGAVSRRVLETADTAALKIEKHGSIEITVFTAFDGFTGVPQAEDDSGAVCRERVAQTNQHGGAVEASGHALNIETLAFRPQILVLIPMGSDASAEVRLGYSRHYGVVTKGSQFRLVV
jgi:hypothetical protein